MELNIYNIDFVVYHIVFGLSSNQLNHFSKLVYIFLLIDILRRDFLIYKEVFNALVEVFNCSKRSIYRALNDLLIYGFIDYVNLDGRCIILNDMRD